jgi:DNA-binding response OmpR family regulator
MSGEAKTVVVVDDDPKIRLLLRRCLETEGYRILEAENAAELNAHMENNQVDLITLDLNLGVENGLTIAADLRAKSDIPIIIVTGKGDVIDKVVGLEMGADDYISKPFHIREVLARVRSVMRRSGERASLPAASKSTGTQDSNDRALHFNGWTAYPSRFEITDAGGVAHDLTTSDFNLLMIFLNSPKRVLSRDQIMDQLNGQDWTPYDRTIDNQVARLRKKIEPDPTNPGIIKTVRGIGYTLTADVTVS